MKMKSTLLITLALSACTTQNPTMPNFWTKDPEGTVMVHHIVGKTDTVDKLTTSTFKSEKLPDGKYYKVTSATVPFTPATHVAQVEKPKPADHNNTDKLSEKIASLQRQVEQVVATNQQLEEKVQQNSEPQTPASGNPEEWRLGQ